MRTAAITALASATARYLRYSPVAAGKEWLWHHWVGPYITWRPITSTARTRFGARIRTKFPDTLQTYVFFFGVWEPAITRYVEQTLCQGDTVVDIGANVGYFSLLASSLVGPEGRVFAIEPSPSIFAELRANLDANAARNVYPIRAAVTDRRTTVTIHQHDVQSTIVGSHANRIGATSEATVQGAPLAELVSPDDIAMARLIKIDVDGAEWLVAQGMADVLPRLSPKTEILLEVTEETTRELGGSVTALLAIFAEVGYRAFEISNRYGVDFYVQPQAPELRPYDGKPFAQKDFVLKKVA